MWRTLERPPLESGWYSNWRLELEHQRRWKMRTLCVNVKFCRLVTESGERLLLQLLQACEGSSTSEWPLLLVIFWPSNKSGAEQEKAFLFAFSLLLYSLPHCQCLLTSYIYRKCTSLFNYISCIHFWNAFFPQIVSLLLFFNQWVPNLFIWRTMPIFDCCKVRGVFQVDLFGSILRPHPT